MSETPYRQPPAIFLMGPTASGKSALAVQLAHRLNGEIISVDSALVYRGMDIGTAKPSMKERQGIPHHLIDIIEPSETYSTGHFRTQALELAAEIHRKGRVPILVGGTMLYFNALSGGIARLPEADPELRAKLDEDLRREGKQALHERLARIDPTAAARIHPNDPQRIQRALEVYELSGKPLSSFFSETASLAMPYQAVKLIVAPENRQTLHEIIALRFRNMLNQGFIEEVEELRRRGDLHEALPSIRAVGYRQIWSYLNGEISRADMIEKGIAATRQLAKRQFTWLRRETEATQLRSDDPELLDNALQAIENKMPLLLAR